MHGGKISGFVRPRQRGLGFEMVMVNFEFSKSRSAKHIESVDRARTVP